MIDELNKVFTFRLHILKRNLWRIVDRNLRKVGLERISQQLVKELAIDMDGNLKLEMRNGFRWSGRQHSSYLTAILNTDNPLIPSEG